MVVYRNLRFLLLIVALVVLQACATMATGEMFEPISPTAKGQAVIYIFRPNQQYARAVAPDLTVDGAKVGAIQNAGYLAVSVAPGRHTVDIPYNFWSWGDHCAPAVVQAKAGAAYFVQIELSSKSTFLLIVTAVESHCALKEVTPDVALPLIKQTRLSQH